LTHLRRRRGPEIDIYSTGAVRPQRGQNHSVTG
jgi:hypothetical protein